LVLDQERIDARRDAIFCCLRKKDSWEPNECSKKSFLENTFRRYSNVLDKIPFKMSILMLTGALFAASCCGLCQIKTNLNIADYLPPGSRLEKISNAQLKYFPEDKIR
jgi:predicted RND superfamily exporter protein